MPVVPSPTDSSQRRETLQALAMFDSDAERASGGEHGEPIFDALTRAAAAATGRPIALISLVAADRSSLKSTIGAARLAPPPRYLAFCADAARHPERLEVPDARKDPRFAEISLASGSPRIRFYAGTPIVMGDGSRIGTLAVLGREPGTLDDVQRSVLKALADAAADALQQRKAALDRRIALEREAEALRQEVREGAATSAQLRASESFLESIERVAGVGGWAVELASGEIIWSSQSCRIHEVPDDFRPTLEQALDFYTPEARIQVRDAVDAARTRGEAWDLQLSMVTAKGRDIWVRAVGKAEYDADGQPCRLVGALQDVTLRRRVTLALETSDRRFRKLFQYSLGLICTHDHEGVLLSVNPAAANSLGYSIGELIGRPLTDFMPPRRHASFRDYLLRILTHDSAAGMMELVAKDGTLRTWQYQNVLDDESDDPYVLGHAQDVTAQQEQERQLLEWSIRDPLTGCFNRRYLAELAPQIEAARWACVAIDLDHFKQVNDTHGHERGDQVLVAMADFLGGLVRPDDAVVRLGGDEFLVLLRDADDEATADVVRRIERERADAPIEFTLGVAMLAQGAALEAGMAEADRRLYEVRAKRPAQSR